MLVELHVSFVKGKWIPQPNCGAIAADVQLDDSNPDRRQLDVDDF